MLSVCVLYSVKKMSLGGLMTTQSVFWDTAHWKSCRYKTSGSFSLLYLCSWIHVGVNYLCLCAGRGLFGRILRDFHSGKTNQEDLLQTWTVSWEVDQHFIRPTHPARSSGQVTHKMLPTVPVCLETLSRLDNLTCDVDIFLLAVQVCPFHFCCRMHCFSKETRMFWRI